MKIFDLAKGIIPFIATFIVGVLVASVLGFFTWSSTENTVPATSPVPREVRWDGHCPMEGKHHRGEKRKKRKHRENYSEGETMWLNVPPPPAPPAPPAPPEM
ncbi:MAG: hypothetical protein ACK5NT_02620 [Pyrinomonadaceae bacterium]